MPKRFSTEARVSPGRNLTPTRGGSSEATGGGSWGLWSSCGEFRKGAHNNMTRAATATPAKRAAAARKRLKNHPLKYLRRLITMNQNRPNPFTVIFECGQRKTMHFFEKWKISHPRFDKAGHKFPQMGVNFSFLPIGRHNYQNGAGRALTLTKFCRLRITDSGRRVRKTALCGKRNWRTRQG